MAKTVLTSATSYLPASEVAVRHDVRILGDLLGDLGARLDAAAVAASANLAAILLDASGIVESACLRGGRYTPVDLQALTGAGLRFLYRLMDGLVFSMCWERRYPEKELPAWCEFSLKALEMLEAGERIFSFQETADAGRTTHEVENEDDVVNRNGITYQADRFFGRRSNRRDPL